jgi:photosystem II stability/assembly factor-like uncharacterized protein
MKSTFARSGSFSIIVSAAAAVTLALPGVQLAPPKAELAVAATGAKGCPSGYTRIGAAEGGGSSVFGRHGLPGPKGALKGVGHLWHGGCMSLKHPEPLADLAGGYRQQFAKLAAPKGKIPRNAYIKAIKQRNKIAHQGQSASARKKWTLYGKGPLLGDVKDYTSVAGYGLKKLSGRITNFFYIPATDKHHPDTVLASVAYGGVYASTNDGESWKSIGNKLPTQVVGAVGYTGAGGGRVLALTGDGSFGRYSREGSGLYYSSNFGKKWKRARGLPSDAFGFKIAVDDAHPKIVYAATGAGLWRSTNAGARFTNVKLPVGKCAGKSNRVKGCLLANMVTDVVVKKPGGSTDDKGGQVLAAVGWRGGNRANPDGSVQSPANGLYYSDTGKPKSFAKLDATGFAPQERIGRVEMGAAIGDDQDHNYVYAMVQDAVLQRGGTPGIDMDNPGGAPSLPTVFNGIYVSADFGATWTKMADATELQHPATGSALAVTAQQGGYGPGIQSWYNEWIQPDPSRQAGGIPTRLLFGLEEVWMNEQTDAPQAGPSSFRVVGRYYAGSSCLFLQTGLPVCPTDRDDPVDDVTTTHPDQQAGIFVPEEDGVTLVVGNDGGAYRQTVASATDFTNAGWGDGSQTGLNTLLPYDAVIAKDGTAYAGLQDNGSMKITNNQQIEVYGGDGFFVGVDPHNSDVAYEEYVYGAMNATKDGGKTWTAMNPPGLDGTTAQFSNPFALDPKDPDHIMIAGNQVDETGSGPGTSSTDWAVVYHLGTAKHPGDESAVATEDDPLNSMTAIDLYNANAYVGYCGTCAVLDTAAPFKNGVATNVGGKGKPKRYESSGWHIAKAKGLPNRYITAIAMNRKSPKKAFFGLGGYSARWTVPNSLDKNPRAGKGHLFFTKNAGKSFKDVSGNLPNTPVNWLAQRGRQIIVSTDVGVFITKPGSSCRKGCKFELLGKGLPSAPVFTTRVAVCDPNLLTAAVYGRGVYTYRFGPAKPCPEPKPLPDPPFKGEKVAGPFDFETGTDGWEATSNNQAGAWRTAPPGNASSQSFQFAPYTDDTTGAIVSPKIDLPDRSSVKVSWFERRDTEDCCDYLSVEWSSDLHVWHSATAAAGKNADFPLFSPNETKFVAPKGPLYIRFRLTSDALVSSPAYTGVAVDQILIER